VGQGRDGKTTGPHDRGGHPDEPEDGHDDVIPGPQESDEQVAAPRRDWFSRLILWLTAVVLVLVLLVIAAAYLPGWWVNRVADVVAGNQVAGVLGGLACGAVFSILPLVALRSALRPRLRWSARLVRLVEAVLLTVPNLLTLGVAARGGQDGEVARAVLDVRAPGFAVSTLVGVVVGAVLVVVSWVLLAGRRRRLHELDDLRTRLELRDAHDRDARDDRNRDARSRDDRNRSPDDRPRDVYDHPRDS
jgi:hypothetical protein